MTPFVRSGLGLILLGLLHLLAAPVYALVGISRLLRAWARQAAIRRGIVTCPHCGAENPLDRLASCRRCGFREFGSVLFCSNCRQITETIPCESCTASIRVL